MGSEGNPEPTSSTEFSDNRWLSPRTLPLARPRELPVKTKNYLEFMSDKANIKIDVVSVGPKRDQTFFVN